MSLRRVPVAALLLAPVVAEIALRLAPPAQWGVVAMPYLAACVAFAVLAGRSRPIEACPAEAPPRRWLLLVAAAATVACLAVAWRDLRLWALVPIWAIAVAAWVGGWLRLSRPSAPSRRQLLIAAALIGAAAFLRLYRLGDLQSIQIDELYATHIVVGRTWANWENPTGPLDLFAVSRGDADGQLMLGTYHRLLVFLVGGISMVTLRLPSALIGVAEVGLVFFLGRLLFGFRVGLVAAATLATLTAHLSFSRHGLVNLEASLVWTTTALLLGLGFATRRPAWLALAGLVLGLALYFYPAARPILLVTLALVATAAVDPVLRGRWLVRGSALLAAGFVVGAGPLLVAYYRDPAILFYRASHTAWLGAAIAAFQASGDLGALAPLWEHFRSALLAYNVVASADNRYWPGRGLFTALPAGLLYGAVALVSLRLRDWRHRLLALWFWVPTLVLSALSDFTPAVHRLLPVLPACALLIGLAFDRVLSTWQVLGGRARRLAAPVGGLALAAVMVHEAAFYFNDYARRDLWPWINGMVQYVLVSPPGRHIVLLTAHPALYELSFATAGGRRNTSAVFLRPVDELPETAARRQGVTYLVHTERTPWLVLLRAAYPGGHLQRLESHDPALGDDRTIWHAYTVSAEEVERRRGLRVTVADARQRTIELRSPTVTLPADLPTDLEYPLRVEWRGWLQRALSDHQRLRLLSTGSASPRLRLGDTELDFAEHDRRPVDLLLTPGGHPLFAATRLASPADTVELQWNRPIPAAWSAFPLDRATDWPDDPRVLIEWLDPDGPSVMRREYDVAIADHSLGLRAPSQRPHLVRYQATLQVEEPGSFEFELRADGPVRLVVGNRQIWPQSGDGPGRLGAPERNRVRVSLTAGSHPLLVERDTREGGGVALLWRRGGGPQMLVPPSALAPLAWP